MAKKSLADTSREMAGIDIAILSTHAENGEIANRPMSNSGDVAYAGTSYYFTYEQARTGSDIQRNPKAALGFSSEAGLKAALQQHWTSDLDKWFDHGIDAQGLVLITVRANRMTYWKGREEGEVEL